MLSIEQCRELMPHTDNMTDEQVAALRADLYQMAELALESYFHSLGVKPPQFENK
jgi:hypothetical protein